jgi:CelD/BcsL family acetyltransferase involved in cellulose biosynthesis
MHQVFRPARLQQRRVAVREARADELLNWDLLVRRFDNHRIVHTTSWVRSLENSTGARPLFLVFETGGDIVGCFPGLLTRVGPLRLFGSPLVGWQTCSMGPVFDRSRLSTEEMMSAAIGLLEDRYNVHHIELINGELDHAAMHDLGFTSEAIPTYRVPLFPMDEGRTLSRLKDNARRNIRRAIKLGLSVRFETDESFVDEAYDQIKEVFVRGGNTVPFGKRRVLEFFRCLKEDDSLIAASVYLPDDEVRVATGLFSICGQELFLWQWAHRTRYRWYRPTELMTWTVMKKAMEAGCTTFDLMGLGDFKQKFGAVVDHSQYRWVRSRYQWLARVRSVAERSYRWQQSVRGHLAQWALRPAGPADQPGGVDE